MKVLQTIQSLARSSGGPSTCTCDLMDGLFEIKSNTDLLTVTCNQLQDHNLGEGSSWLKEVENDYKTSLCFSKNIKKTLLCSDYDIYHANALWSYSSHITCKIAREKHKPYVLSPHGMLYPTALAIKTWKKWPMLKLWFNKDIHSAACLHATCVQEMEHCRTFGYKGPIAVIPNAVIFPEGIELATFKPAGKKQIGFLGRLHPIKKVENIIYAMGLLKQQLKKKGLELKYLLSFHVMGKYDDNYENFLKAEVIRLGLDDCVEFVGFVSGKEKYNRLSKLWALIVPSVQENFGMIVPEALICGTPVYASLGTPWEELNVYNCGWWKDNEPETIAGIIREILAMNEEDNLAMGTRGRQLMEEKYEQHKAAGMMKQLYEWIANGDTKPDFVNIL